MIKASIKDVRTVSQLKSQMVIDYLARNGWTKQEEQGLFYYNVCYPDLLMLSKPEDPDFKQQVLQIIHVLAAINGVSELDIFKQMGGHINTTEVLLVCPVCNRDQWVFIEDFGINMIRNGPYTCGNCSDSQEMVIKRMLGIPYIREQMF